MFLSFRALVSGICWFRKKTLSIYVWYFFLKGDLWVLPLFKQGQWKKKSQMSVEENWHLMEGGMLLACNKYHRGSKWLTANFRATHSHYHWWRWRWGQPTSQNSHTVTTNRTVIFPQEAQDNNQAIPATPLEQNAADLARLKHES